MLELLVTLTAVNLFFLLICMRSLVNIMNDVDEIKAMLNGRMNELLELTRTAYRAVGVKEEKDAHESKERNIGN